MTLSWSFFYAIFCVSFYFSVFPIPWKHALVFPIAKCGDSSDWNNYFPIPVTLITSNVFETIIFDQLWSFLEREKLLSDHQYTVRKHRLIDPLAVVFHPWSVALNNHGETHLVSLDNSKAFDRVWHECLLATLPTFKSPSDLALWTLNFLVKRTISVRSLCMPVFSNFP